MARERTKINDSRITVGSRPHTQSNKISRSHARLPRVNQRPVKFGPSQAETWEEGSPKCLQGSVQRLPGIGQVPAQTTWGSRKPGPSCRTPQLPDNKNRSSASCREETLTGVSFPQRQTYKDGSPTRLPGVTQSDPMGSLENFFVLPLRGKLSFNNGAVPCCCSTVVLQLLCVQSLKWH